VDRSGNISVVEYCLFFTFHEASIGNMVKFFAPGQQRPDLREIKVSKTQLSEYLRGRANRINFGIRSTILPDGRHGACSPEDYRKALEKFLNNMFTEFSDITLKDLVDIKLWIRDDVFRYEFNTFEVKDGTISGGDFAKSILAYVPSDLAQRSMNTDVFRDGQRVDFKDFKNFKNFMYDNFKDLDREFKDIGIVTKKRFHVILEDLMKKYNTPMTEFQVNTLFQIIDHNNNNRLEAKEFRGVLSNLMHLGRNTEGRTASESLPPIIDLKQEWETFVDKALRIWDIIKE